MTTMTIDDFTLLKVIGKGGFSRVFMVRKKDSGALYAMKVMKKAWVVSESKFRQTMSERTLMERLIYHPFIIQLHWAFQSKEELHLVMDLCTGGELLFHL